MGARIPFEEGTRRFIESELLRIIFVVFNKKPFLEIFGTDSQSPRYSFNILLLQNRRYLPTAVSTGRAINFSIYFLKQSVNNGIQFLDFNIISL